MKIDDYKKRMFYTLAVTLIIVFSTTYAILMTLERTDYRNYLQSNYSKNLYELVGNVQNIEDSLGKSVVASSDEQTILLFQDIFRYAASANDELHSLPISSEVSQETSKFLTQVGDYCYALVKGTMDGKKLTDADYKVVDTLEEQSYTLKQHLNNALADINNGKVKWGEIRKKVSGVIAAEDENLVTEKFGNIEKQVNEYPALIYDGPFSDNILEIKPRVNALKEVTVENAEDVIKTIYGADKIEKIEVRNTTGQTKISSFSFNVLLKGRGNNENIVCEVSKNGGKIVYLLDNRKYSQPTMDEKKATDIGSVFLNKIGYKDMKATYSTKYEDNIVINYVHSVKNVMVYPEQIKLKIALDDGSITAIDAEKYLISMNENRSIPKAKLSLKEAKTKVSKRLTINSEQLTIIPTETNSEILCYEFNGNYKENQFLIYVNAANGKIQRILKIINTPNGKLTI